MGLDYEADGIARDVTVEFEPGAIISTLVGSTAECHARPINGGEATTVAGVATVMSAAVVRAIWGAWSVPAGAVAIHVRVIPPAGIPQTVYTEEFELQPSLKPRP
jgi:hypothetical protein